MIYSFLSLVSMVTTTCVLFCALCGDLDFSANPCYASVCESCHPGVWCTEAAMPSWSRKAQILFSRPLPCGVNATKLHLSNLLGRQRLQPLSMMSALTGPLWANSRFMASVSQTLLGFSLFYVHVQNKSNISHISGHFLLWNQSNW